MLLLSSYEHDQQHTCIVWCVYMCGCVSVKTRRSVHNACVMLVLVCGSECWVPHRRDLKRLNVFHHKCVHTVLGITNKESVGGTHLFISSERTVGRCGDDWDYTDATSPRIARTPGPDEGPQTSQDVPIWMASPDSAMWRSKKEVERHGKVGPEGYAGWQRLVQCGTGQGKMEECMESKPGRAPNSATQKTADRREECAMWSVWEEV